MHAMPGVKIHIYDLLSYALKMRFQALLERALIRDNEHAFKQKYSILKHSAA